MRKQTKANSGLNGEWAQHVRRWLKKHTAKLRRIESRRILKEQLES